jgi:hypothetical protein
MRVGAWCALINAHAMQLLCFRELYRGHVLSKQAQTATFCQKRKQSKGGLLASQAQHNGKLNFKRVCCTHHSKIGDPNDYCYRKRRQYRQLALGWHRAEGSAMGVPLAEASGHSGSSLVAVLTNRLWVCPLCPMHG